MNSFKIQLVKQQALLPAAIPIKPAPKLDMSIQSIVCLNYPIEILSQIVEAHFDDEPCPANLIIKALKVISISLKDKQLRSSIEKIISSNIHKRERVYTLVQYWCSIMPNIVAVLSKIDVKLVENMIGCAVSEYCFTKRQRNQSISKMICSILATFTSQSCNKINQIVKNQYFSMGCPFENFLKVTKKLNLSDQKLFEFINELASSVMRTKQTQFALKDIFSKYMENIQIRASIDSYFSSFPNLINYFSMGLQQKLSATQILGIWSHIGQYKMEHAIKSAIKQWINVGKNYWEVFVVNFNTLRKENNIGGLMSLFELGLELDQQNLNSYITKQYIYNYFGGNKIQSESQAKIVQSLMANKESYKKIHSAVDQIGQIVKASNNIQNNGPVNLLITNKIHAPPNWAKTDLKMLRSVSIKIIQPFVEKLTKIYEKAEQKTKQKGQKIELSFHSIVLNVRDEDQSMREIVVTLHQLAIMLKQNQIPANININEEYRPFETEAKKVQVLKQVRSIVIEAKIVRVMKKSNKKLTFPQLFQQLKQLNASQQNCKKALDKVIDKGIVAEQSEGVYIYCP